MSGQRLLPAPLSLGAILTRAALAFTLCYGFAVLAPTAYPRLLVASLRGLAPWITGPALSRYSVRLDHQMILFEAESERLRPLVNRSGKPGPSYTVTGQQKISDLNLLPVIAGTLVLAWPRTGLRRSLALPLAILLTVVFGTWDLLVSIRWLEAQAFSAAWPAWEAQLDPSPALAGHLNSIREELARLGYAKSFLSTGGRAFLAVLAAVLAAVPLPRRPAEVPQPPLPRPGR